MRNKRLFRLFMIVAAMMMVLIPKTADGQNISDTEHKWSFTFFGASIGETTNRLLSSGDGIESDVSLMSVSFKEDGSINKKGGKFVADSPADGASYYYTEIDPSKENFVLQADVKVDQMNPAPDGQEGFALMARDAIWDAGTKGNCMANLMSVAGTGFPDEDAVMSSKSGDTIGFRGYTGVFTHESSDENMIRPVRHTWWKDAQGDTVKIKQGECYRLRLEKTSNAYIGTQYRIGEQGETEEVIGTYTYYIPAIDNNATEVSSYAELNDPLNVQEENKAYVALVAARGMNVTFRNISFVTSEWNASEWEPQPEVGVDPDYRILSPETSGDDTYELMFEANADGTAEISRGGQIIDSDVRISAGTRWMKEYDLAGDETVFSVRYTPDPDYRISVFEKLNDYSPQTVSVNVTQRKIGSSDRIYVKADGLPLHEGKSMDDALDLPTALRFVRPGQTILLKSETYKFTEGSLIIEQGRNGREDAPITMTTEDGGFATFDFSQKGEGFKCRGDFWNFSRINITNTANNCVGMLLSGSHNTLKHMNFYNNGTTGLQICGSSSDEKSLWPSHNTVINCTSMNNADKAMEDADGFACKLMSGEGNVFKGCIAAYNADDGWDLYSKVAVGTIGRVEIRNCVAYKNGYLKVKDGGTSKNFELAEIQSDINGRLSFGDGIEMAAGNGNGFKMGGSNMSTDHCLMDSKAYENKKKGIDSNSNPAIVVSKCVSYNNEAVNVSLYTENSKVVTAFEVDDVISYRKDKDANFSDNILLQGQEESQIRKDSNYFWDADALCSSNSLGERVSDDWFISLDTTVMPEWGENGTVNMHGLLCLKEKDPGVTPTEKDKVKEKIKAAKAKKVKIVSVKAKKGKKALVKWKKVSGVSGYQITYSTSKKFAKKKTRSVTVSAGKAKQTLKKLKAGKRYYVKVRPYTKVKSAGKTVKVYGKYSKVKRFKARK